LLREEPEGLEPRPQATATSVRTGRDEAGWALGLSRSSHAARGCDITLPQRGHGAPIEPSNTVLQSSSRQSAAARSSILKAGRRADSIRLTIAFLSRGRGPPGPKPECLTSGARRSST